MLSCPMEQGEEGVCSMEHLPSVRWVVLRGL